MIFSLLLKENVLRASYLQWNPATLECYSVIEVGDTTIGLAARDMNAGESIEYCPGANTADIITKAESKDTLLVIKSHNWNKRTDFTACIDVKNDVVVEAAPIIRTMTGWTLEEVRKYCALKKWTIE